MPPKASENTLKEQVVQVVLPDGDVDVRLASIDFKAGHLVLKRLSFDDSGEVSIGEAVNVKLASLGAAVAEGAVVKLHAGNRLGRVLLQLDFDGNETVANAWADALGKGAPASPARSAPPSARRPEGGAEGGATGDAGGMLKSLIQQQEEQVKLLETIIERKSEQVLQMQTHLEGALEKLQLGQELYAEQQGVVNSQQQKIQELQERFQSSRHQAASTAEAACVRNAAEAAAGAAAAARARAAAGKAAARPPQVPPPSPEADDEEEEEEDSEEERHLLAKLKALEEEKAQCEEQLRKEQGDIVAQTQALQAMMAALNLPADLLQGASA